MDPAGSRYAGPAAGGAPELDGRRRDLGLGLEIGEGDRLEGDLGPADPIIVRLR